MFKKKIKLKIHNENCDFRKNQFGNWIDLSVNGETRLKGPQLKVIATHKGEMQVPNHMALYIPLGVSMTLPKWYGAKVKPRSSTFKKYGIIQTNSVGEIEYDFSQEWMFPALCFSKTTIPNGERICQFQVKLREDAPWYMKIADLFVSGFKYQEVDVLTTTRGGLGSTDKIK